MKKLWFVISIIMIVTLLAACTPAPAPAPATQKPVEPTKAPEKPAEPTKAPEKPAEPTKAPEKPAEPTKAPEVKQPTDVKFVIFTSTSLEEPWNSVYVDAWKRVAAAKPHGLNITWDVAENVTVSDIARVAKEYAQTGKYTFYVFHDGNFKDVSLDFKEKYPDTLIITNGSVFEPAGGNYYHSNVYVHECAYLLGRIAGKMTKSGKVGAVGAFPYPNVNLPINAFFEGAKAVNPKVKQVVTYIDSWWDPAKGKESAAAQISAGADYIYAERFGPFEAAKAAKTFAFGHYSDQYSLAPEVVVSSTIARWDPAIMKALEMWWEKTVNGKAYDAPKTTYLPTMKEGVCDIAPYHNFDGVVPQDVKDDVEKTKQDIISGKLVIKGNEAQAKSD